MPPALNTAFHPWFSECFQIRQDSLVTDFVLLRFKAWLLRLAPES